MLIQYWILSRYDNWLFVLMKIGFLYFKYIFFYKINCYYLQVIIMEQWMLGLIFNKQYEIKYTNSSFNICIFNCYFIFHVYICFRRYMLPRDFIGPLCWVNSPSSFTMPIKKKILIYSTTQRKFYLND